MELDKVLSTANVIFDLEEDVRKRIGSELVDRVVEDEQSRQDWMDKYNDYLKMALQVAEVKSFPWPRAANVKYPLLTIAALQFQARAMPAILGDGKQIVRGKVIGYDPTGEKAEKAERIGKHMSFQLLEEIDNWEEDMDKLLILLPICGTVFKKVYWDDFKKKTVIDLVTPDDLIVNYWAKSLRDSRRITHRFYLYHNEFISRQRDGKYLDEEMQLPDAQGRGQEADDRQKLKFTSSDSKDIPHEMLEVHTYWDMDEDGYEEPWIFTIERNTKTLVRAVPNFDLQSIRKNADDETVEIVPKEFFVKYGFIPSPDGGFYDVGFGILLGSLNETASTAINQLLDAGTMSTTGGGLLGKGIKLKGGNVSFAPNEWKQVSFNGDDLRKHIFPLPVKEPSPVLLQLLQLISASGKEIISISEISTGKLPGQNTPATTTLTSIEEGLKLFNSIYKRVYRAEKRELQLLFSVNKDFLEETAYFNILDAKEGETFTGQVSKEEDYNDKGLDVVPLADPNTVSDSIRLIKAQSLVELIPLGAVDPAAAGQRIIQAMDLPNPKELLPQPKPDPKAQAMQMKAQGDQMKIQGEMQKNDQEMQLKAQEAQMEMAMRQMEMRMKMMEKKMDLMTKQEELRLKSFQTAVDLDSSHQRHQSEMAQIKEKHALSMQGEAEKIEMNRKKNEMAVRGKGGQSRTKQGRLS